MSSQWGSEVIRQSCADALITEEPYERIVHVRICGGRRGKPRPLPGTLPLTIPNDPLWKYTRYRGWSSEGDTPILIIGFYPEPRQPPSNCLQRTKIPRTVDP